LPSKLAGRGTAPTIVRPADCFKNFSLKADGRYFKLLAQLAKTDLLVLDDWGLEGPNAEQRRILLDLLDDRYDNRSTLISSQLPTDLWHNFLADPTLADAILDRILHNAYRLELTGESMRKSRAKNL
jgi:DNA replication protein DnaC